ncbi:hypothetical protein NLG97_g9542 [Lecanicillium saksenae]|uniref:Uncharacterized protein n=1 Tax=Lecanicillium saksenae TaxID=468837 RepID=A0ACC1QH72_9HYPO|nr:hypothetical protein NLG97_g9542 [Lecanicillium saksenae]
MNTGPVPIYPPGPGLPAPRIVRGFQRAGSMPLRRLPLKITYNDEYWRLIEAHENDIDRVVYSTLYYEGYFPENISLEAAKDEHDPKKTRWSIASLSDGGDGDNDDSYLTVLITTPWDGRTAQSCERILVKIKRWINYLTKNTGFTVLVEMRSTQVAGINYISAVRNRPDLDRDWEDIKAAVIRILESHEQWAWNAVSLFQFGQSTDVNENHATVHIAMSYESRETQWRPAVAQIERYLLGHDLKLHMIQIQPRSRQLVKLEMLPPYTVPEMDNPLVTLDPYEERVSIGADMSASCYIVAANSTGTNQAQPQESHTFGRNQRTSRNQQSSQRQRNIDGPRRSQGQRPLQGQGPQNQGPPPGYRPTQGFQGQGLPQGPPRHGHSGQRPPQSQGSSQGQGPSQSHQVQPSPQRPPQVRPEGSEKRFHSLVGTFTCYVQIRREKDGPWQLFGLTNYHLVRCIVPGFEVTAKGNYLIPAEGSALRHTDIHGHKPGDRFASAATLESPSRIRHNKSVAYLNKVIEKAPGEQTRAKRQQVLQEYCNFFDSEKHIFGQLYAASGFGFRTPENGMLDWALFKVLPSRVSNNNLPRGDIWPLSLGDCMPPERIWGQPLEGPIPPSETCTISEAYNFSAITKATTGTLSKHKSGIRCTEWGYLVEEQICSKTDEYAFISKNLVAGPGFATDGDSGAVVYDGRARAVGQLFRGGTKDYVTPMEYILAHIAEFLGLSRDAVRIAEF